MNIAVFGTGMMMSLSLLLAIGAQNAFVLRQGLLGEHVLATCLVCAVSDAVLITIGVTSLTGISSCIPWLEPGLRFGGAAFLFVYGAKHLVAAFQTDQALLADTSAEKNDLYWTVVACLAITWLNPHVYLDTVVFLGTVSTQFSENQTSFAIGAILGSFVFFFGLGYGATRLRPLFARPQAWQILEAVVWMVMWAIAFALILGR